MGTPTRATIIAIVYHVGSYGLDCGKGHCPKLVTLFPWLVHSLGSAINCPLKGTGDSPSITK